MIPTFHCLIRSLDQVVFEGQVRAVTLPAVDGEMQVLAGHADAFLAVGEGRITVEEAGGSTRPLPAPGGVCRISGGNATIVI